MARLILVLAGDAILSAQPGADLYKQHCAGCHGPNGEGSRGPSLRVPTLKRANDAPSLIALLRRGVPATEMPATPESVINEQQLRGLADYVLSLRTGVVAAPSGPAARGAEIFRTKGKCLDCHLLNGEGRPVAPDLSTIGRDRQSTWLRRALIDPQADIYDSFSGYRWTIQIPDNYLLVELKTKGGEQISGARINEDAFSIQVRDGQGRIRSFLKSELANLEKRWGKSPMPSYRDVLSSSELDDLVAYLASLRGTR